MNQAGGIDP
jgi:hypothetical protein